jgi:hypothetical protein
MGGVNAQESSKYEILEDRVQYAFHDLRALTAAAFLWGDVLAWDEMLKAEYVSSLKNHELHPLKIAG